MGDPSTTELDFQVYTLPYKNKILQEAKLLTINFEYDASEHTEGGYEEVPRKV